MSEAINKWSVIALISLILFMTPVYGFSQDRFEALAKAKSLFDTGDYRQANGILKNLNEEYPGDLNTLWLFAQSSYWAKKFNRSMNLYEEAISRHSDNYYLLLDYGIKLVDIGEFRKAGLVLDKYLAFDKEGPDALIAASKMAYWQGNYRKALSALDRVLGVQPENMHANELRKEIIMTKAPWIRLSATAGQDDQPLFSLVPSVEFGFAGNAFLQPVITLSTPHFITDEKAMIRKTETGLSSLPVGDSISRLINRPFNTGPDGYQSYDFRISNKMNFSKIKASLFTEAGIFFLPTGEESLTGGIKLDKTLSRQFNMEVLAEHKPYLNTRGNMAYPMERLHYDISLNWTGKKGWMGRISHDINDFYSDKNKVHSSGFWLLSSPLKMGVSETRLGYAISYSTSEEDRYTPEKSLSQIIASWMTTQHISGIYFPYFTPREQFVQSAVGQFRYKPSSGFEAGIKGTYGFRGTTQNPYFFLNKNSANEVFIQKEYYRDSYHPYDARVYLGWNISSKVSLKTEYAVLSTYFYKSQMALFSLQIRFWDE
jgi:tetratricopeptide (TPR) repeat protein